MRRVGNVLHCNFRTNTLSNTLEAIPVDENNTVPFEKLNWETIILWRVLVQYLRQNESALSSILPDAVHFCEYIQKYNSFPILVRYLQMFLISGTARGNQRQKQSHV